MRLVSCAAAILPPGSAKCGPFWSTARDFECCETTPRLRFESLEFARWRRSDPLVIHHDVSRMMGTE